MNQNERELLDDLKWAACAAVGLVKAPPLPPLTEAEKAEHIQFLLSLGVTPNDPIERFEAKPRYYTPGNPMRRSRTR